MNRSTELSGYPPSRVGAGGATLGRRAWRSALTVLAWPARVHRARQLMHELGRLGDHELRDIGLTRLDLQAVEALPLDADPSRLLRRRAEESRRRR